MEHHVREMVRTNSQPPVFDRDALAACIVACFECAQSCEACAGACLGDTDEVLALVRCIRLNQDCADICFLAGRVLSRGMQPDRELVSKQIELCMLACEHCAQECDRHAARHEQCRVCAESCRQCLATCREATRHLTSARIRKATH